MILNEMPQDSFIIYVNEDFQEVITTKSAWDKKLGIFGVATLKVQEGQKSMPVIVWASINNDYEVKKPKENVGAYIHEAVQRMFNIKRDEKFPKVLIPKA